MKVGIVGLGCRLGYLARVFQARVSGFEVAAYVDPAPAGRDYVEEHGVSLGPAFESLEEMLQQMDLDLLMIGSPNHLHLEHLRIGLDHGIRIFCEKPVVTTEDGTMALLRLLAEYGPDRVLVGLVLRYSPLYRDLRAAQAEGLLGEVASIEASEHIAPYHGAFFLRDWRRYECFSGSFLLEKCCHDLDLYQGVAGARPARVASFGGRRMFTPEHRPNEGEDKELLRKPSGWLGAGAVYESDGDIVDNQTALIEYENGVNLCFHTNINVPDEFRRFCIVGAEGMAEGDFVRNFFRVHAARDRACLIDRSYKASDLSVHYGADEQMVDDLAAHLQDGAPLPVSVINALEAGLTAIKIDEARRTGQVVDLTRTWANFDACLLGQRAHG